MAVHGGERGEFLPTPSARRATKVCHLLQCALGFLPTPSARRATRPCAVLHDSPELFLPTPSARRATADRRLTGRQRRISTHALREEGDLFPDL